MTIAPKHVYFAVAILALAVVAGFVLQAYVAGERDKASYAQLKADNEQYFKELDKKNDERWQAYLTQQKLIEADKRNVQTPEQVAQSMPKYIPTLPVPVQLHQPTGVGDDTAPSLIIPQPDIKPLFDFSADCQLCKIERDALKGENTDLKVRVQKQADQLKQSEQIAKGGGFFTRLRRGAKHVACSSAGTGAGIGVGMKTKPIVGAATGLGAFAACELL